MKKIIFIALIASLFGCSVQPTVKQDVTHNWTAKQRILKLQFADNNKYCANQAIDVQSYEACMQEHGYTLTPSRG